MPWIKGGAPGQAVISESVDSDWLMTGDEGKPMTESRSAGRSGTLLLPQAVITDGEWDGIGLVSDGLERTRYIDDRLT